MKKASIVCSILTLFFFTSVSSGTIQSINVNYVDSGFSASGGDFGLGVFSLSDVVDIVVEDAAGTQTTHDNGSFSMTMSLEQDTSSGGIASGIFSGGSLLFLDNSSSTLFSGDVLNVGVEELFDNFGMLAGTGQFEVTGGSLSGDFVPSTGNIVQITFQIVPAAIDDFSQDFTGISNITFTPIPEPAALVMLSVGGLLLCRRKRQ